jgi:hypothetical protein
LRVYLIVAIIAALSLYLLWQKSPATAARLLKKSAVVALILGIVLLVATGRLHWLFALGASLLPFARRLLPLLRYVPLLQRLVSQYRQAGAGQGPATGQTSTVTSRFLRMSLDHDSGEMTGVILEGQFKGRQLSELDLDQLRGLYTECQSQDQQSAALLQAYLERVHADQWHAQGEKGAGAGQRGPDTSAMTRDEAYEILGLESGASREAIVDAHRRLMQKVHPDRGGSTYLAAKINQAKDILLS